MERAPKRNFIWIYIFTAILAVLGIVGLSRGDWVSGAYLLGAVGLVVWIYGTLRGRHRAVRLGLILAGAGLAILIADLVREFIA